MNAIETLRRRVISENMELATIQKVWAAWKLAICNYVNPTSTSAAELKDLGNHMYDVFKTTSAGTRSQSEVSAGGTAWECLVCWYLNLCLLGRNTVVIKTKKPNTPTPISDCITVMYGTTPSGTESDLLAITFPDTVRLKKAYTGSKVGLKRLLDSELTHHFSDSSLTVIQCKTNWNDNAQIPMLWDLIYQSKGGFHPATVGHNGFVNNNLKHFGYAFETVPTTDPAKIKQSSTCVLRVRNLSGGNYWGKPHASGVAMNVYEILNKNFKESLSKYPNGWNADISRLIVDQTLADDYFLLK